MNNNGSPLEHLAATAISFCAGVVFAAGLSAYAKWLKRSSQT
jgi:hypothetical protein